MISDAQTEALDRVQEILCEHFEASMVIVEYHTDDDDKTTMTAVCRNASRATALGLCEIGKDYVSNPPPDLG